MRSSSLGGVAADAAVGLGLGIISFVVARLVPAAEGLEIVVAGLVAVSSFAAEVWTRWRLGLLQQYAEDFVHLHKRVDELEAENLRLKYPDPLRVHIDRELYGTISPSIDGFGYVKELRLWNLKITNLSDNPVNLTFYVHFVGEGWNPKGDWVRHKVSLRNWGETRYWKEDSKTLIGRTLAVPGKGTSEDDLWLVFALPVGEVADVTESYTRMRDVLRLEANDDITGTSTYRDFLAYLYDFPLIELTPPPSREEGSSTPSVDS